MAIVVCEVDGGESEGGVGGMCVRFMVAAA